MKSYEKVKKLYEDVNGKIEKVKPLHKTKGITKNNNQVNRKKWGDMTSNKDKENDKITEGSEKAPETTNKKQSHRMWHEKNNHSSSAIDFVGKNPDIDRILCLLFGKTGE